MVWSPLVAKEDVGFTVIITSMGDPLHPFAPGVTV